MKHVSLAIGISVMLLLPIASFASEDETLEVKQEKIYENNGQVILHMQKYAKHIEGMECDAKLKEEALSDSYNKVRELETITKEMRGEDISQKKDSLMLLKRETKSGHELMRSWHGRIIASRHNYAVDKLEKGINKISEKIEKLKDEELYDDVDWNEVDRALGEARDNLDAAKKALEEANDAQDEKNFDLVKEKNETVHEHLKEVVRLLKESTKVLKEAVQSHENNEESFILRTLSLA